MLVLREQHHYYYQVHGQMAICSRKWCNSLFFFTNAGIFIQQIFFDKVFSTLSASKLTFFHSNAVVPKLANILGGVFLIYIDDHQHNFMKNDIFHTYMEGAII